MAPGAVSVRGVRAGPGGAGARVVNLYEGDQIDPVRQEGVKRLRALGRRRKARTAGRVLFFLAAAALCALVLSFVVAPYLSGDTGSNPLVRKTGGTGPAGALLALALILDLGIALVYVPLLRHRRAFFKRLTRAAGTCDRSGLARFMNALGSAAAKAGVTAPGIAVLALPVANALSFERDGKPVIGLTADLLEAHLSPAEAEAIMAVELAGVVSGNLLRRPSPIAFKPAAYALLGVFAPLGLFASPMVSVGRGLGWGIGFLVAVIALLLGGGLAIRALDGAGPRNYAQADRFAVETAVEPKALAGAIRKLDAMSNGSPKMPFPENEMALDRFFTPVYCFSDTPESFVRRRRSELRMKERKQAEEYQVEGVRQAMDERRHKGEELVAARLTVIDGVRHHS